MALNQLKLGPAIEEDPFAVAPVGTKRYGLGPAIERDPFAPADSGSILTDIPKSIVRGIDRAGEAMGGTLEMFGLGFGTKVKELYKERAERPEIAKPQYLQEGTVVDHPERLVDPRWWVNIIGENLPNMAIMMAPGAAGYKGAKALGLGAKGVQRAAMGGAAVGAFSIEAGGAYNDAKSEMLEMGYPKDQAETVATLEGSVVGVVNSLLEIAPFNVLLKNPGSKKLLSRVIRQGLWEGGTEGVQENVNMLVAELGHKPDTTLKDKIGRTIESVLAGAVLGGGAGVFGGAEIPPETKPPSGEPEKVAGPPSFVPERIVTPPAEASAGVFQEEFAKQDQLTAEEQALRRSGVGQKALTGQLEPSQTLTKPHKPSSDVAKAEKTPEKVKGPEPFEPAKIIKKAPEKAPEVEPEKVEKPVEAKKAEVVPIPTKRAEKIRELDFEDWAERVTKKYPTFGMTDEEVSNWAANIRRNAIKEHSEALENYNKMGAETKLSFMGVETERTAADALKEAKEYLERSKKTARLILSQHKKDKDSLYVEGKGWRDPEKPPTEPPKEAPKGKEPWNDTYDWLDGKKAWEVSVEDFVHKMPTKLKYAIATPSHQLAVKQAHRAGEKVPEIALRTYEDLKPTPAAETAEIAGEVVEVEKKGFKQLIEATGKGGYFNLNETTGQVAFLSPFKPTIGKVDPRYSATPFKGNVADLELNVGTLPPKIKKAYIKWRSVFARENKDKYNELINQEPTVEVKPPKAAEPVTPKAEKEPLPVIEEVVPRKEYDETDSDSYQVGMRVQDRRSGRDKGTLTRVDDLGYGRITFEYKADGGGIRAAQPKDIDILRVKLAEKPSKERKPVVPKAEVKKPEVEITGAEDKAVSVDIPEAQAEALSPKEQKKYLLAEIDKAIDEELKKVGFEPRKDVEKFLTKTFNPLSASDTWYTFEVPADGVFNILGSQLFEFQRRAQGFPTTTKFKKFPFPHMKSTAGQINYPAERKRFEKALLNIKPKDFLPEDIPGLFNDVVLSANKDQRSRLSRDFADWLLEKDVSPDVVRAIKKEMVVGEQYSTTPLPKPTQDDTLEKIKEGLNALYSAKKRSKTAGKTRSSKGSQLRALFKKHGIKNPGAVRIASGGKLGRNYRRIIKRAFGTNVVFFKSTEHASIEGIVLPGVDNTVFINQSQGTPLLPLLGHELGHVLANQHPDLYHKLLKVLRDDIQNFQEYWDTLNINREAAGMDPLGDKGAMGEFFADFMGKQFTEKEFWQKLHSKDPSLTERIIAILQGLMDRLKQAWTRFPTENYFADVEKAQDVLAGVVAEFSERQRGQTGAGTQKGEPQFAFAGVKAKTADVPALSRAIIMESEGKDMEAIRQKTGWYLWNDKKWRFEIDDSKMTMKERDVLSWGTREDMKAGNRTSTLLSDLIDHPELFKAYPQLERVSVSFVPDMKGGSYRSKADSGGWVETIEVGYDRKTGDMSKETLLHEIQHAVQEIEGFARGGSLSTAKNYIAELEGALKEATTDYMELNKELGIKNLWSEYTKVMHQKPYVYESAKAITDKIHTLEKEPRYGELSDTIRNLRKEIEKSIDNPLQSKAGARVYWRLAGEIEAREAALRKNLTPEQRKIVPLYLDGIPKEDIIVRMGTGPQYSVEQTKEDLHEDSLFVVEKWSSIFKKPKRVSGKKADLSYFNDLIAGLPAFFSETYKDSIKAIKSIYNSSQERMEEKSELEDYMEKNEVKGLPGVTNTVKAMEKLSKKDFKKFQKYLVKTDRMEFGFRVKNTEVGWQVLDRSGHNVLATVPNEFEALDKMLELEAQDLQKQGFTPEQVNAVMAVRMTTNKGFELLFAPMRELIKLAEAGKIKMPMVGVIEEGKAVQINLNKAMARMGDMRGFYFPRIRPQGRYVMTAKKDGEFSILETFTIERLKTARIKKLEKQGYKVTVRENEQLGEDVFQLTGPLIKTQQIVNAALEKIGKTAKAAASKSAIDELNKDLEDIFATSLAEQISNVIRERGARAHMTRRGPHVYTGYEENPLKAIPKYIKGLAGAEAKKNMTIKMIRALTGTETSWEDFQIQNPEADYEDYRNHVNEMMISQPKQKNAFKWAMAYIGENTRNPDLADNVVGWLRGAAVGKYLAFRVFSAPLVNLTALPTSVIASLKGAGISYGGAWRELGKGLTQYGRYRAGKLNKKNQWIFDYMHSKGWDNAQYSSESLSVLRSTLGAGWDKAIEIGMFTFSESEKLNRAATISAAYNGLSKLKKNSGKSKEEIAEMAKQVSDSSHGVYNKGNYPYIALGGNPAAHVARMFYVFQRFSHTYLLNMRKMGFETKDYTALAHMVVAPAVLAGAGASVLTPIISTILKAFGIDEPEEEVYQAVGDHFGPSAENLARFGLAGAAGFSIKGSLALGVGAIPTSVKDVLGAPGSVMSDIFIDGIPAIAQGNIEKGFEKVMPTGMGNLIRAYRESTEGLTTRSNRPIFYGREPVKLDKSETFLRAVSLYPSRIATIREKQWKEYRTERKYSEKRADIYARIRKYYLSSNRSTEKWIDILAEITVYNERAVKYRAMPIITQKSIMNNLKRSFKPSRKERLR